MKTWPPSLAALLLLLALAGAANAAADPWARLRFLVGEWTGESVGTAGSGGTTFALELDDRILVRHNRADYPATADRPAQSHRDLMIVYPEPDSGLRAIYFDDEGHVIRYRVSFGAERRVVFTSLESAAGPRFRLSYEPQPDGSLDVAFDTAPPGGELKRYLTGRLRRLGAAGSK